MSKNKLRNDTTVNDASVTETLVTDNVATETLVTETLVTDNVATETLVTETLVTETEAKKKIDLSDFADLVPKSFEELSNNSNASTVGRGNSKFALLAKIFAAAGLSNSEANARIATYMEIKPNQQIAWYTREVATNHHYAAKCKALLEDFQLGRIDLTKFK